MANWNPWHGCHKISEGCKNCYVYRMDLKHQKDSSDVHKTGNFSLPMKRNRKKEYKIASGEIVYTCFTSDFFLDKADDWRIEAWNMIRTRKDLEFFFITKRIDRFSISLPDDWNHGYENVTIGCTCENQERANYRLPIFNALPIKHKIIICEPLLENIDLSQFLNEKIEKVVVGGESGENARICKLDWVLDIREQCKKFNIPFWFKQTGARFVKENKLYYIPRKLQGVQANKANLNLFLDV